MRKILLLVICMFVLNFGVCLGAEKDIKGNVNKINYDIINQVYNVELIDSDGYTWALESVNVNMIIDLLEHKDFNIMFDNMDNNDIYDDEIISITFDN